MFRKIITELLYSPALAERVGEYSRQLRQEKARRQIGLVFIALALMMQLFSLLLPSEASNAANRSAFIDGSIRSQDEYLQYYDKNVKDIHDLFESLGISRSDIQNTRLAEVRISDDLRVWSTIQTTADSQPYSFYTSTGRSILVYHQSLDNLPSFSDTDTILAYIGASETIDWFAITKDGGNLITKSSNDLPCSDITICSQTIKSSLSAYNISSNKPARGDRATPSDRVIYTLSVQNIGDTEADIPLSLRIKDVLEYAQIVNTGGSDFDAIAKTLYWQPVSLQPGEGIERSIIVQLLADTPSFAQGQYNISSYDCTISTSFGNAIDIPVTCPFVKHIEQFVSSLPVVPIRIIIFFIAALAVVPAYLYLYAKQLLGEIHIIKRRNIGGV